MPFREAITLTKSGVPFDIALTLPDEMRRGFCIIAGEIEGGKFNWSRMAFEDPAP